MPAAISKTFSPDGKVTEYYWVLGDQKKPPILLIPGFTGTHGDLLQFAHFLAAKYFVILPDLPGWGQSLPFAKKLSLHNYAVYLKSLTTELGYSKVTLCGHCMGSGIAIEYAHFFPGSADRLILISVPFLKGTMNFNFFTHLLSAYRYSPKKLHWLFFLWRSRILNVPAWFFMLQVKDKRQKLNIMLSTILHQPDQCEEAVEENWISLIKFNFKKIKDIKVPIHLIHGERDYLVNRDSILRFHAMVPHASLDFIPDAGHIPPIETPHALARIILSYPDTPT